MFPLRHMESCGSVLTCAVHGSFVSVDGAFFQLSHTGNPRDVLTRGGTASLETELFLLLNGEHISYWKFEKWKFNTRSTEFLFRIKHIDVFFGILKVQLFMFFYRVLRGNDGTSKVNNIQNCKYCNWKANFCIILRYQINLVATIVISETPQTG